MTGNLIPCADFELVLASLDSQAYTTMKSLFDPPVKQELLDRVQKVTEKSQRQWGKMTPDQMLSHINMSLSYPLGDVTVKFGRSPGFKQKLLRWFTLTPIPIPKAKAETLPEYKREGHYDIPAEKAKFTGLLERFVVKDKNAPWSPSPVFGELDAEEWGKILYKHTDHHLKQFGV